MKRLFPLAVIGLLLTGCSTTSQNTSVVQNENANVTMAEAASTISDALTSSDAIQRATTSPLALKKLTDANDYDMSMLASVDWSGPIGPIVKRIAEVSHYRLRVLGPMPSLPVLISIDEKNVPLGDILRNIDYQARSRANIVVFPETKVIELRYGRS